MRILHDSEISAPFLLSYELTSVARRKIIAYPNKAEVFEQASQIAFSIPIHWYDVDHLAVLRLATLTDLTTYDACYLYLSRKLNLPLVTFVQRLSKATLS